MTEHTISANLPINTFAAIGRVIVYWSHMQDLMDIAIYNMTGLSPITGSWVTTPLRFNARMDILRSVGWNYFWPNDALQREFYTHINEITDCYHERNKIDHAKWWHFGPDDQPSMRVHTTFKTIESPEDRRMTADDIESIAERIHTAMHAFNDFLAAYPGKRRASRGKPPQPTQT